MKKLILLFIPILFNELFGINVKEINYSIDSESYPTTSDAIYIENDTIYCCSKSSLLVFKIDNDKILLLQEKKFIGELNSIYKVNDIIILTSPKPENLIYILKINETNKNITITPMDTIRIKGCIVNGFFNGNLLLNSLLPDKTWETYLYSLNEEKYIDTIIAEVSQYPINNYKSEFLYTVTSNKILIYKLGKTGLIRLSRFEFTSLSAPYHCSFIADSICIFSSVKSGLCILDITKFPFAKAKYIIDIPILSFEVVENTNKIVCASGRDMYLCDFSQLDSVVIVDKFHFKNESIQNLIYGNNHLILTTSDGRLLNYKINENKLDSISHYSRFGPFEEMAIHENDIYINSCLKGIIRIINATNTYEQASNRWINLTSKNTNLRKVRNFKSSLVLYQESATNSDINTYLVNFVTNKMELINLNLPNNLILVDDFYFFYYKNGNIYLSSIDKKIVDKKILEISSKKNSKVELFYNDNYIYLHVDSKVWVYKFDINTNSCTFISKFSIYVKGNLNVKFYDTLMFISSSQFNNSCDIYDISEREDIVLVNSISKGGELEVDAENKLLIIGKNTCSLYRISDLECIQFNHIYEIPDYSQVKQLEYKFIDGRNVLVILEENCCRFFEYSL